MTIAIDNVDSVTDSGPTVVVVPDFVVGSGIDKLLIVGASFNNHNTDGPIEVETVTFGTQDLLKKGVAVISDDGRAEIWYLVNPGTTTDDVTVTFDRNTDGAIVVGAISFFGVDQDVPLRDIVTNTGTSMFPTVTVPSAENELVLDVLAVETGGGAGDADETQIERWSIFNNVGHDIWGASSTEPGASPNVDMDWTGNFSEDDWAIAAVSILPKVPATEAPPVGLGRQRARLDLFESLVFALEGYDVTLSPWSRWLAYFGLDYLNQRWLWTYEGQPVTDNQWSAIEQHLDDALNEIMTSI